MRRNISLILLSIVFGLCLFEVFLRAFAPPRNVGPAFTVYDETYGKRLKRRFHATRTTPEFSMTLSTNSLGFRGAEPQKPLEHPIMFLGDSFTLGFGVNDGQEFPALVETALKRQRPDLDLRFVNAGLGNIGTDYWLKFLRREGRKYDPRLIVLQLTGNDFRDNLKEPLFTLSKDGTLREPPVPPRNSARRVQELIDSVPGLSHLYLVGFARQVYTHFHAPHDARPTAPALDESKIQAGDALTFRLVQEILLLAKERAWPLVVVTVGIKGERLTELKARFDRTGTPSLVLPDKDDRPALYYVVDGHWNAAGHAFVAQTITDWLIKNDGMWRR